MTDSTTASSVEHLDPVCGMTVDPADAAASFEYRGRTYLLLQSELSRAFSSRSERIRDRGRRSEASSACMAALNSLASMMSAPM
jgi:YHS domain-containing protein